MLRPAHGRCNRQAATVAPVLLVCLFAGASTAHALEPLLRERGFRHDVWRKRDGLPSDVVRAMHQASDGYMWIATQEGVVRFDGARFRPLNVPRADELINRDVFDLREDAQRTTWFATQGQGVYRLRGGLLEQLDTRRGLSHNFTRTISPAPDGVVWIGTSRGVTRVRDDQISNVPREGPDGANTVRSMVTGADGALWIGTAMGLRRLVNGRWANAQTGTAADTGEVRALLADRDGSIWVGVRGAGVVQVGGVPGRRFGAAEGLDGDVVALLRDRSGRLWAGTTTSLHWLEGERFVRAELEPLCERRLVGLAEDREGGLWVGTNGCGLHRFSDRPEIRLIPFEGQPSTVHGAPDGTVAVGRWDGAVDRIAPTAAPWPATGLGSVPALFVEASNRAWIVGQGQVLYRAQSNQVDRADLTGLPGVQAVHRDRQGRLWLGLADTEVVVRIDPDGSRRSFKTSDGVHLPRLFYEADDGTLWLITAKGISRFLGDRFQPYQVVSQGDPYVSSLWQDGKGRLWLTSSLFGLGALYDDGKVRFFGINHGLPTRRLFFLTADAQERVWFSGSEGIFYVRKSALDDLVAGRRTQVSPVSFGPAERVHMPSYQAGRQPGWRAPDGKMYMVGERAVVQIDPGLSRAQPVSPAAVIEEVLVDELQPAERAQITLGPTRGDLQIHYTALTFEAPEQVRFRYRLDGFDADWVDAGTARVARYTKVPPGSFRFRVAAWRAGQNAPGEEAGFALTLRPPFHRTGLFYGLIVLAVGAAAVGLHRLRLAAARGRYEAILAERTRMAREIHDTLAQGFAAISAQIECARDALTQQPALAQKDLERARELCRASLQEARRTVWGLRPEAIERQGLSGALQEVAAQFEGTHTVQVTVDGERRRLPTPVEDNLLRIAQEALANAVRYARARTLKVQLSYDRSQVRLSVQDDGEGLPADAPTDGRPRLGLVGMRERATAIGASFEIHSDARGTRIDVEVNA